MGPLHTCTRIPCCRHGAGDFLFCLRGAREFSSSFRETCRLDAWPVRPAMRENTPHPKKIRDEFLWGPISHVCHDNGETA